MVKVPFCTARDKPSDSEILNAFVTSGKKRDPEEFERLVAAERAYFNKMFDPFAAAAATAVDSDARARGASAPNQAVSQRLGSTFMGTAVVKREPATLKFSTRLLSQSKSEEVIHISDSPENKA